jgi:colicin import membrane protein
MKQVKQVKKANDVLRAEHSEFQSGPALTLYLVSRCAPVDIHPDARRKLYGITAGPMPQLAISAVVVDESKLNKAANKASEQRQRDLAEQQRREQEQQKQAELLKQQQQQQQQEKQTQQAEEQRRQQKIADQRRQEDARKAEDQQRINEQRQRDQQQREATERAEAERIRRAQEARATENRAQIQRESELSAAMAAEEDLFAAQSSGEMNRYIALIKQKVERNWLKPASAKLGLECEVAVVQLPNGDVVGVDTVRCNGDDAVKRSIESAVRRSSPLPLPDNRMLFDRNIAFIFSPQ